MEGYINIDQLIEFFDEVEDDRLALFDHKLKGGRVLGIKDFFRSYYHGRTCRYRSSEIDIARGRFHMIFEDNKFILVKLEHEVDCLYELGQIDKNWKDTHTVTTNHETSGEMVSQLSSLDTQTDKRGITLADVQGEVDASQFSKVKSMDDALRSAPDRIMNYLDPSTRSRTHNVHRETGENVLSIQQDNNSTNRNKGTFRSATMSAMSNPSRDYRQFLALRLPEIRREFLSSFEILFYF